MADDRGLQIAQILAAVVRTLLAEPTPQSTLDRMVRLATATIGNCEHAGITVLRGRIVSSPAASDDISAALERLQAQTGEGPGLDVIRRHEDFQTAHLPEEKRWPAFAARAHDEMGIESILAFRLFTQEKTLGALNLYSTRPDAFDDQNVAVGALYATHAAIAMSTSQEIWNLRDAMNTRGLIGQAVGFLMAREDASEEEAFDMLVRASQRLNIKLRLVAEDVIRRRPPSGAPSGAPSGDPPAGGQVTGSDGGSAGSG